MYRRCGASQPTPTPLTCKAEANWTGASDSGTKRRRKKSGKGVRFNERSCMTEHKTPDALDVARLKAKLYLFAGNPCSTSWECVGSRLFWPGDATRAADVFLSIAASGAIYFWWDKRVTYQSKPSATAAHVQWGLSLRMEHPFTIDILLRSLRRSSCVRRLFES